MKRQKPEEPYHVYVGFYSTFLAAVSRTTSGAEVPAEMAREVTCETAITPTGMEVI